MTSRPAGPASPVEAITLDEALCVAPDTTLGDVVRLLVDRCVGAVLVVDERPAIVTEQTLLRALAEATNRDTPIGEIALDRPLTVSQGAFVRDAAELMVVEAVQQLAVIDDDRRVLGILPASRVLEALLQGVDPGAWAIMRRLTRS